MYSLSTASQLPPPALQAAQTKTAIASLRPDALPMDPMFEPLERAGRAITEALRKDELFPELDTLVTRISWESIGVDCNRRS